MKGGGAKGRPRLAYGDGPGSGRRRLRPATSTAGERGAVNGWPGGGIGVGGGGAVDDRLAGDDIALAVRWRSQQLSARRNPRRIASATWALAAGAQSTAGGRRPGWRGEPVEAALAAVAVVVEVHEFLQ